MHLIDDLRHAIRSLSRAPSFSLLVILVLALGIGFSTAMYSVISALLLNPVPYPQHDRLMMVWDYGPKGGPSPVAFGTMRELTARSRSIESATVSRSWAPALSGIGEPERLQGQRVSAEYFQTLGVQPAIGPGMDAKADRPGGARQAVISDRLWKTRFAGDRSTVGSDIELDSQSWHVVGVMPADFTDVLAPSSDVWGVLQYDPNLPAEGREWGKHLRMLAKLAPGASLTSLRQELQQISQESDPAFSRAEHARLEHGLIVNTLGDQLTHAAKPGLLAAFGAVLLLLLIACVNVINLLLVRGSQRSREFEARVALGASPGRLLWQQLTEVLALSLFGGGLGLGLAYLSLDLLNHLAPAELIAGRQLVVNTQALVFALAVATAVGIAVGLLPARRASRSAAFKGLQPRGRGVVGHERRARNSLVVIEVALAVVLLVSAGLLLSSLNRLFAVESGFDTERLLTAQVHTSGPRYSDAAATERFFAQTLDAVRALPTVEHAAWTSQLPLSEDLSEYGVSFESMPDAPGNATYNALRYAVSPGYFETMSIPLDLGRTLAQSDSANAPKVALISHSLAKKHFAGSNPIGRRLHIGAPDGPWFTVVGVVGDVKQASLIANPVDAVYANAAQWLWADPVRSLVVRYRGPPDALAEQMRQAIWSLDGERPISRVVTMEQLLSISATDRRFASVIFSAFGFAALLLAAMGIYSALSVSVAERSGEIGLRMALGARASLVLRWG